MVMGTPSTVIETKDPTVTGVTVTPATATVAGGATQAFAAVVAGEEGVDSEGGAVAVPQDVVWSATAGSITEDGVFTAPAATDEAQTVTVTATSAADASVSGTATVTVPGVKAPEVEKVTVTDAKKTLAEEFANTMYWGVKIAGGAEGVDLLLSDGQDTKAINNLGFEGIELNGDVTFGVYVTLSSARLDRAISLKVTETGTGKSATSTAVAYSELN
jgi:hypothetical protein